MKNKLNYQNKLNIYNENQLLAVKMKLIKDKYFDSCEYSAAFIISDLMPWVKTVWIFFIFLLIYF